MRDVVHFLKSGSGVWSPTYSQLLALAERSAQQSIRMHRKTYSPGISSGRSVRAEIIPRWTGGGGLLIHRPASSRRTALRSVRLVLPSLRCHSTLRDGEKGKSEMLKIRSNSGVARTESDPSS